MGAVDAVPVGVAARLLGLSDNTVRRMVRAGKLTSWRTPGGHRRLDLSDVNAARQALRATQQRDVLGVGAAGGELPVFSGAGALHPPLDDKAYARRVMNEAMERVIASRPASTSSHRPRRAGGR